MSSSDSKAELSDLKYIRVYWVGHSGTARCRIYPADRLKDRTCKLPWVVLELGAEDFPPADGNFTEEIVLKIDWSSLQRLSYIAQPTAAVFGTAVRKDPTVQPQALGFCPRTALIRAIDYAKSKHDIEMLFGFELEFALLESLEPVKFAQQGARGLLSANKLSGSSKLWAFADELYDALRAMGIGIPSFHAESAPSQLEFALDPLPPLEAVDQLVIAKDAVFTVAEKHGLHATFAPKLVANAAGSGQHIHISIKRKPNDQPLDLSTPIIGAMTKTEQHFLAGLVKALPALSGITLPSVASYERVGGPLSGGTYAAYGEDNRECPIRLCCDQVGGFETRKYNFELRNNDGTSNPYLVVAALVHAGLLGIEDGLQLGPPAQRVPSAMSEAERQKLGLTQKLPTTLYDAFTALRGNSRLVGRIGKEAIDSHLRVRNVAADEYEGMSPEAKRVYMFRYY